MRYDTIFFDIDDTLFDFGKTEQNALQKAFTDFGLPSGVQDYRPRYKEISKILGLLEPEENVILLGKGSETVFLTNKRILIRKNQF